MAQNSSQPASDALVRKSKANTLAKIKQNGASTKSSTAESNLKAPVTSLAGHTAEVCSAKFSPSGNLLASTSFDQSILLWRIHGTPENYGILNGHKGAVLDARWSRDEEILYSASADMYLASWNLGTGQRIRRYAGHEGIVNCVDVGRRGTELLYSGSDDGYIGLWDPRCKGAVEWLEGEYPVTSVAVSEDGQTLYAGGIMEDIKIWDLRKQEVVGSLAGHTDTVTSVSISPDGNHLLSFGFDNVARIWDIRPFAAAEGKSGKGRCIKTLEGANVGIEKNLMRASWSCDGKQVAAGTGDGLVVVWDVASGKAVYNLAGHKGCANDVQFSPTEASVIVSASSDRTMLLGELGRVPVEILSSGEACGKKETLAFTVRRTRSTMTLRAGGTQVKLLGRSSLEYAQIFQNK